MARIACLPFAPRLGETAANQRTITDTLSTASAAGADVIVLPELATSGYVFRTPEEVQGCALSVDGPEIAAWSTALNGKSVAVAGFPERGADGRVYNSAALIDASGVQTVHRKAHLWDREKLYFTPGDGPAPVVDTAFGRIAVLICYDLEFPEYTRRAALDGADLLAVPVNWPLLSRPHGERPPEVVIAQAAARVNRTVIAVCDRGGRERGQEWMEGTSIIGQDGWVLASGTSTDDGGVWAQADLEASRDKQLNGHNDLFGDRRPELYAGPVA